MPDFKRQMAIHNSDGAMVRDSQSPRNTTLWNTWKPSFPYRPHIRRPDVPRLSSDSLRSGPGETRSSLMMAGNLGMTIAPPSPSRTLFSADVPDPTTVTRGGTRARIELRYGELSYEGPSERRADGLMEHLRHVGDCLSTDISVRYSPA